MSVQTTPAGWLLGSILAAVMALELGFLFTGDATLRLLAHAGVAGFALVGLRVFRLREFYLIAVASVLTGIAFATTPEPVATVMKAFDQAAFLVAFILLLKLLEAGATTSHAILTCGAYLTHQPSGRRYAGLSLGSHLLGVIVNLGTVSLLAPLIQRGVREGLAKGAALDDIGAARERRQLTALLRGFSWMVVWSPTAVAPAVLLTLLPGIDGPKLVVLGAATAVALLALGWVEDWVRWRRFRARLIAERRHPGHDLLPFPGRAFLQLVTVCALLAGCTVAFAALGNVKVVPGLMLAAPVVGISWILAQNIRSGAHGAVRATAGRLAEFVFVILPSTARIAMTLGCSGFIGTIAAGLVPVETLARILHPETLPGWLFLASLPVAMTLTGHLAVSPIMMAVFFGTILGAMPQLPAEMTLVALALSSGWAMSMCATPFASVVLLTSQVTGIPATTLTWRWNAAYSLAAAIVLTGIFYVLTGGR